MNTKNNESNSGCLYLLCAFAGACMMALFLATEKAHHLEISLLFFILSKLNK